jgi:hypothetical protein
MNRETCLISPLNLDEGIERLEKSVAPLEPAPLLAWKEDHIPELVGKVSKESCRLAQKKTYTNLWAMHWEATLSPASPGSVIKLSAQPHPWLSLGRRAYVALIALGFAASVYGGSLLFRDGKGFDLHAGLVVWTFLLSLAGAWYANHCEKRYRRMAELEEQYVRARLAETLDARESRLPGFGESSAEQAA